MFTSPQTKISTINNMDYNDINQHSTDLTNINSQNQSPIHPITLSYSQNKQTLNTQPMVIFQPQIIYQLLFKETHHVHLGFFHLSPHARYFRQKPPNPLQQCLFIRLQTYFLMNKEYPLLLQ